jgi:hypothetical protein
MIHIMRKLHIHISFVVSRRPACACLVRCACALARAQLSLLRFGPALPSFNRFLIRNEWLLTTLSWSTMVFEVVAVPAMLVSPPAVRPLAALGSLGLHVGIALAQSAGIGLAFIPNAAVYFLGFSADGPLVVEAWGWWLASALAVRWRPGGLDDDDDMMMT